MTSHKISIDDDIFAFLAKEAIPFVETTPNDVLRRLLLAKRTTTPGKTGLLMALIDDEKLRPGDRLVHHQPRKRRTFFAEVAADGFIQLEDGQRFSEPSPALRACVGNQINGWDNWVVERLNRPLGDLRT